MGDEVSVGFQPEQEGGIPSESVQQDAGTETPQQQYVTLDQFKSLQETIGNMIDRKLQSLTDKAGDRISKQVKAQVETLKAIEAEMAGLPANTPPEVRAKIFNDALSSSGGDFETALTPEQEEEIKATNKAAQLIERRSGTKLESGDPELATIVQDKGPDAFLDSFEAALANKKTRLEGATQTTTTGGSPIARMPAMGGGTPSKGLEALTLELNRLNEKTGRTQADLKRMRELDKEIGEAVKNR